MGSPPPGKCVLEGKKLRKQQPPPLYRCHLVVGLGCTSQGSGAGKVFLSPLSSEIISWESTGEDVLLEALQVPLVPPVVRGTLLPRLAAPHAPLPGGCFFLFFASGCFC